MGSERSYLGLPIINSPIVLYGPARKGNGYASQKTKTAVGNTLKRKEIGLLDLYDTLVMTQYHHIVIALHYVAIEEHYDKNAFDKALYAKANGLQNTQQNFARFELLIGSIETKGYNVRSAVYVDRNGSCFNGIYRLALCVWFQVKKIPAYMVKCSLHLPSVQDMKLRYGLSDGEYAQMEEAYQRMRVRLQEK